MKSAPLLWTQFEHETLLRLRDARACLAKAGGMCGADKMTAWSLRALELATQVQDLATEIEVNQTRVLQESCR